MKFVSLFLMAGVLLLAGCYHTLAPYGDNTTNKTTDVECQTDSDCVPASCCHASACISKDLAPECSGIACTLECKSDTIDCGGGCACVNGKCNAYFAAQV